MRKLAAVVVACLLLPVLAGTAAASTSKTITTTVTVGAGHTYPGGAYGFTDGCETGISAGQEMRCSFEFDISSVSSSAKVTSATLAIRRTGGCATNDCPVAIGSYTGNGSADLGDVVAGGNIATWTPTSNTEHFWNVVGQIQAHATNGEHWAGFNLKFSAANSAVQDFDLAGSGLYLSVSYVSLPVGVQIYLSGVGEGANGTVTSSPAGIDCGATCLWWFEYAEPVTLTAHPASGATFGYWQSGPCAQSTNPVCTFEIPALDVEAGALFYGIEATPAPTPRPTSGPTPKPSSTAKLATPKPSATSGAGVSAAPASVEPTVEASAEASAGDTPAASLAPGATPGATPGPTTIPAEPVSGDGSSSLPLILGIVLLLILVAGGAFAFGRRRQPGAPPPPEA